MDGSGDPRCNQRCRSGKVPAHEPLGGPALAQRASLAASGRGEPRGGRRVRL